MITELAPGADPRLAALFAAASAPAELPLSGEPAALTAYRRAHRPSRVASLLGPRPVHMVAAALFSGVILAGGVATAATGSVPIVGHHHAAPVTTADSHDDGQTDSADTDDTAITDGTAADVTSDADDIGDSGPGTAGHPATTPALGSVAKGAATCTAASHGTCQAGQHGKAVDAHTHHVTTQARVAQHRHAHAGALRRHAPGRGVVGLRARHGTNHHSG